MWDGQDVIAMDTYFVPSVNVFNHSYVDIRYPPEIYLPETAENATEAEISQNMTWVPCEAI